MEKVISSFMKYQHEAEERSQKLEEERWKRECEMEEKRRREEREHELRLFQMLGQMMRPRERDDFDYTSSIHPHATLNHMIMTMKRNTR